MNQTEEWFYQVKGSMKLRLVENNKIRDIELKEGEMFLVPGRPQPLNFLTFPYETTHFVFSAADPLQREHTALANPL